MNVTLRIPERLRAQLEEAATISDLSLNAEISRRLERSFEARGLLAELFGSQSSVLLLTTLAAALKIIEARFGDRDWMTDPEARKAVDWAISDIQEAFTKPPEYFEPNLLDRPLPDPKPHPVGREASTLALRIAGKSHPRMSSDKQV
ncbi:hypothetical protein J2X36_005309 [Methylobacterium sp. BE186]|uniref:hypothetical protein n=1 Tax=Methylobacterium sp. BE186 TaxID=2817715 RepID=UPI00285D4A1D|nr:hypothetical protein [Methylobacterium sp. BE186]MDR7040526.1 hypothetical protein [Methylobacterium sp. BE186]